MAAKEFIAVIGGGLMGAAIAQVFASAGHSVRVHEPMAPVRDSFQSRFAELLRTYHLDPSASSRVQVTADMADAVSHAHFVTEAAPERLELKQAIFAELVRHAPREAILASNTSVIPIHRIVGDLPTAERMLGTHWWHPAGLIPLVEVVQSTQTSSEVVSRVMEILRSVGKAPAHVTKDTPGFVANRLQHALWREAIAMVEEGVCDAATLDHCVKMSFGRRLAVLGPLENADMVGLDLTLDIHKVMMPELYCASGPHPYLESKVAAGDLGFKSGSGFREWSEEDKLSLRRRLAEHLLKAKDQLPS